MFKEFSGQLLYFRTLKDKLQISRNSGRVGGLRYGGGKLGFLVSEFVIK